MLTVGATALAPWEVGLLRQRLARALTFSRRYHRQPYCLSTLLKEIGGQVDWFDEPQLTLPAFLLAVPGERTVNMNALIHETPLELLAILHECSHFVLDAGRHDCTEKIESREERDVWFACALIAVSRPLTGLILDGRATVIEIASRCRVPEALVQIRLGLAVVLGEHRAPIGEALDLIRYQLGRLEAWIDAMKARIVSPAR